MASRAKSDAQLSVLNIRINTANEAKGSKAIVPEHSGIQKYIFLIVAYRRLLLLIVQRHQLS